LENGFIESLTDGRGLTRVV